MLLKEAIGTGETIVEAQEDACRQLGVETHEANFDVLQMPEKRNLVFLGEVLQRFAHFWKFPLHKAQRII